MIINRNLPPIVMNQQRVGQSISHQNKSELRTAFEELAKRDFAAGKNLSQAYHGSEHQELMRLAASPDRRGIIS